VAYIIGSLQKAHNKDYEKDLEEAERGNYTLPWLIQRLSRTATNLAMKGKKEDEAEFTGTAQDVRIVYCLPNGKRIKSSLVQHGEQALMIEQDPSVSCPRCGKDGHSADNC
jgi:hypothetical protein